MLPYNLRPNLNHGLVESLCQRRWAQLAVVLMSLTTCISVLPPR